MNICDRPCARPGRWQVFRTPKSFPLPFPRIIICQMGRIHLHFTRLLWNRVRQQMKMIYKDFLWDSISFLSILVIQLTLSFHFQVRLPLIWHILWSSDSENKSQLAPASWGAEQFLNKIPEVIKSLGKSSKYLHCLQNQWNVSLHPGQMTYEGTQSC